MDDEFCRVFANEILLDWGRPPPWRCLGLVLVWCWQPDTVSVQCKSANQGRTPKPSSSLNPSLVVFAPRKVQVPWCSRRPVETWNGLEWLRHFPSFFLFFSSSPALLSMGSGTGPLRHHATASIAANFLRLRHRCVRWLSTSTDCLSVISIRPLEWLYGSSAQHQRDNETATRQSPRAKQLTVGSRATKSWLTAVDDMPQLLAWVGQPSWLPEHLPLAVVEQHQSVSASRAADKPQDFFFSFKSRSLLSSCLAQALQPYQERQERRWH